MSARLFTIQILLHIRTHSSMCCPVCLGDVHANATQLPCAHTLCRACMWRYTVTHGGSSCPLCRAAIDEKTMRVFLHQRPTTRHSAQYAEREFLMWKCRSLLVRLKSPNTRAVIRSTAEELRRMADENIEARDEIEESLGGEAVVEEHMGVLHALWPFIPWHTRFRVFLRRARSASFWR